MAKITIEQQIRSAFIKAAKVFIEELEKPIPVIPDVIVEKRKREKYLSTSQKINRRVDKFSLEGKYIQSYKSVLHAAKVNKVYWGSVYKCCKGKQFTAGGYKWSFTLSD
jgi:hypothetical protein